jgi:prepilin signal peptidase PulO-like enzyme (type II secretory pathway)
MGFGDVKLFTGFGAIMGTELAYLSLIIGASLALVVIIPYRYFTRKDMKSPLPFGPFLGFAAPVSYLFGNAILDKIGSYMYKLV